MQTTVGKRERIGVFCGTRIGARMEYLEFARSFGGSLARRGLELVYDAAGIGAMGALADGALAAGGDVTGVVRCEPGGGERSDRPGGAMFIVRTVQDRKALVYRLSSAFAVLPGGIDALDELLGVAACNQLNTAEKPIVVVNYDGFFDPMLDLLAHLSKE